ncbi:MAG TPA: hypothetical protein VGS06_08480 [Streptosporangiaceae bacterium]|nr:hypothetical protein [Streptosporangiaceae bacterium]
MARDRGTARPARLAPDRREPTLLGYELVIRTSPDGKLASQVIHEAHVIAERLAGIEGLPYGRIDVETTGRPFELRISAPTTRGRSPSGTRPWPETPRTRR